MSSTTTTTTTPEALPATDLRPERARPWQRATTALRRIEPWGRSALLLALRLLYGWQFVQTGWGKLANLDRTTGFFEILGLPAPGATAVLVGATELLGGLLLAAGLGARFAAAALAGVMVVAYATAHAADAFASLEAFTAQAPYPFLVATLVLSAFGAGRISIDRWIERRSPNGRSSPLPGGRGR
ncbi:MAG: DoxX family protein [Deltaproteobacteria bacterium]|nr:DoxX family protein [Deltaproteobacteria bacterium]